MRICLISREYPPDTGWGGVGSSNYYLAHGLRDLGHEVEVISLAAKKTGNSLPAQSRVVDPDGVIVHRVEWEDLLSELNLLLVSIPTSHFVLKSGIPLWQKFLALHTEKPFDVVEVPEHLSGGFFQTVTKIVPTVIKLHTPHSKLMYERFHNLEPTFDNQLICWLERVAMMQADGICSPSEDMAAFVAGDLNYPLNKIRIVRYPMDTERFNPNGPKARENPGQLTVMFAGRLEERKGIHYLVDAIPSIAAAVENVRFLIVGADTNTEHGEKSVLEGLKESLSKSGCLDKVEFVSHVPLPQMPEYFRSGDVCVAPSLYDNAPFTCIEAMACGRPVVATTSGGMKEYVRNGEFGLIVPPRSSEKLAEAIIDLLKNESKRLKFGADARTFVETRLQRQVIAQEMIDTYEQARESFKARSQFPLYMKPPEEALNDVASLLCAYDQMMFDVLGRLAPGFKAKSWARLMRKRPKLAVMRTVLSGLNRLTYNGNKQLPILSGLADRLEVEVDKRTGQPYELTMSEISLEKAKIN